MQRRHVLQAAAAATLALPGATLWAAPVAGRPKFILVFLRGAYDAANVLVPYTSEFYYESRPHIAVPRPGSGADAAVALDADWALHPALRASLLPLWQAGQLAFVPFAGTRDLSRSHFETQDHIELGQGGQTRSYDDGFLNRLLQQLGGGTRPMAFSAQLPLSLRGPRRVPNLAIASAGRPGIAPGQQALLERMWGGTAQSASVREGFAVQATVARDMQAADWNAEMRAASRGAVAPRGFVAEAARIGALMRESFDVGFIDVGGWDTHVYEASANGAHGQLADKLGALGEGLAALSRSLGPAWRDTTVVVLSEFGRTFRENGNRGTDHGHGTVYWVLGGGVRGGRVVGEQVALSPATLNQNRDYPVLTNDRDLLGGLFSRLWGLDAGRLAAVFPDSRPADLRLV
ncbi:DUF1501 domain-containing protein [Thiomonas sp. FB-6]|uniref:DUF1501 domain-containing protein n=1 Tax=Thiomonas sp. FB-6 TaxID=1158291 RepID=UPI000380C789|nr:DUF1501 domain-containing protein [Thiomonas sp. FB-6]